MKKTGHKVLTLERFLPYRLSILSNKVSAIVAETYRDKFALSIVEWRIMAVLGEYPGVSADQVSTKTQIEKSILSRAISKLLQRNLIKRDFDSNDRRRSILALTRTGLSVYDEIVPVSFKYQRELLKCFSGREQQQLSGHAGVGAELDLALGGRTELPGVQPFQGRFTVEAISDGHFQSTGPVAQGKAYNIGPSALLAIGGIRVAVSSRRVQALDRMVFEHLGVVLEDQDIIVLKSTCHYRAHFDPIAETTFAAISPGGYLASPADCAYTKLRPGVRYYPLGPVHPG